MSGRPSGTSGERAPSARCWGSVLQLTSSFSAGLTAAEREVALQLLKGQSHKEIAYATGRSERTVRQHAVAVYQKSGLRGRAELAAFFLEDLILPTGVTQAGAERQSDGRAEGGRTESARGR